MKEYLKDAVIQIGWLLYILVVLTVAGVIMGILVLGVDHILRIFHMPEITEFNVLNTKMDLKPVLQEIHKNESSKPN